MKKLLALLLALVMILSLAACGNDAQDDDDDDKKTTISDKPTGDKETDPTDGSTASSEGTEDPSMPPSEDHGPAVTIDPIPHRNGNRDELQLIPFEQPGMTLYLDDSFELDMEYTDGAEFTNGTLDVKWQRIPTDGLQSSITTAKQVMRYWKHSVVNNWDVVWEGEANGAYYLVGSKEDSAKGFAIAYYMAEEYYYRISVQTRDLERYQGEMITYITCAQITEDGADESFVPQQKVSIDGLALYLDAAFGVNDEYDYEGSMTAFCTDGREIVTEITINSWDIKELAVKIETTDDLVKHYTDGDDDVAEVGKRNGIDYIVYNDGDGFINVYGLYLMGDRYWTVSFWSVFGYEEHLEKLIDFVTSAKIEIVTPVAHEMDAGFRFWLDTSIGIDGEVSEDWLNFRSDEVRGDVFRCELSLYGLEDASAKDIAEYFAESYKSATDNAVDVDNRNGVYYLVNKNQEYGFGDVIGYYVQGEYFWSITVSTDDMDAYSEKMIQYATSGEIL